MKTTDKKRKGLKASIRSWLLGPISQFNKYPGIYSNDIDAGVVVNGDTALRYTAVFAAIKLLADNIASLPKHVIMHSEDGGYKTVTDHAACMLLSVQPNPYTDIFTFWFTIIGWLEGKGNAFAIIEYDKGVPKAWHQVNPDWVTVVLSKGEKVYVVKSTNPDFAFLDGTYLDFEMMHFMLFTMDGIIGVDPITYNAAAIGVGIAAQKFSADYFRTGGAIKGVLETDLDLGDEEFTKFQAHWRQSAGNGETPLLEYGFKYKPITLSAEASQLIQSKVFTINDIARIFTIPPHMLAELSHATFSNIEQQNIFFGEYSLRPICKRIEQQIELKMFYGKDRMKYNVKFDLNGLMRGDASTRAQFYEKGINAGWMTPNEARSYEGMNALPGLDQPRIPLNITTVGPDGQINKETTE